MPIVQTPLVRKVAGCTTIAHLSDLHTHADTQYQSSTWAALREDLVSARDRIDLLVVTGDLIDNPFLDQVKKTSAARAFAGVCEFLRQLCVAVGLDPVHALSVIAGNHDYRSQGLVFKKGNPALFAQCFGGYVGHRVHPGLRLATFSFDSNADYSHLGLATGYVKPESIIEFASEIETLRKQCADWAGLVKCALVHHHAMPIGPTETRDSIVGLAEHVLLKNAGVFLEEMVKARIDYVLHGHQHYPALSKACYPIGPDDFHTVGVIGAGSAGVGKPPSYYLITFSDKGEVTLEHRSLTTATYDRTLVRKLVPYSEARLRRIEPLAARVPARLNVSHYMRVDKIVAGSGDDVTTETFTNVEPRDGPIAAMPLVLVSRLGMFGDRRYESLTPGQRIDWVWKDPSGSLGERSAEARYAPPLKRGKPVSYTRLGTTFNAVSFNRRDRLDATDQESDSENASVLTLQVYEALTLQVNFPEAHWPTAFRVEAVDQNGGIDDLETSYVAPHLSVLVRLRTVCLAVSRPLPGYAYRIVWNLPNDEEDELDLNPVQAGMAKEILKHAALDRLRGEILATFPPKVGEDALELSLLSYDVGAHGLVVIGSVGHNASGGALASWVVKPGRGIEGQAYRRREVVLFRQSEALELDYYEDLPDSQLEPHAVVMAIPVYYPLTTMQGRRVAVLRIASRSNTSGLLGLDQSDGAGARALTLSAMSWFAKDLGAALNLGTLA